MGFSVALIALNAPSSGVRHLFPVWCVCITFITFNVASPVPPRVGVLSLHLRLSPFLKRLMWLVCSNLSRCCVFLFSVIVRHLAGSILWNTRWNFKYFFSPNGFKWHFIGVINFFIRVIHYFKSSKLIQITVSPSSYHHHIFSVRGCVVLFSVGRL